MSATWTPPSALRWLLGWTSLTTLVFWLATIRGAFDGSSYEWGLGAFSGRGMHGDYWFPVAASLVALIVVACGWRGAGFPVSFVIASWQVFLFGGAFWLALTIPDRFRFTGDTLGIDIPLVWMGPILCGAGAALAIAWTSHSIRRGKVLLAPWGRRNRTWLVVLIGCLPFQFVLLRWGAPDTLSDQLGVLLTAVQWFLVGAVVRPYPPKGTAPG